MARCVGIEPCTLVMDLEGTDGRERGEVFFFFGYTLTYFDNSQGHNSIYCQYPISVCIYISQLGMQICQCVSSPCGTYDAYYKNLWSSYIPVVLTIYL